MTNGTRRGWGVSVTPRPLFTPKKDPVPIVQEAGWDPGPVWTGAESLVPTGIRSPDSPARNQSLYRLRYPAQLSWPCVCHNDVRRRGSITPPILCLCTRYRWAVSTISLPLYLLENKFQLSLNSSLCGPQGHRDIWRKKIAFAGI